MGRISEFTCPSCNVSWKVRLGHGIGHAALENVLDIFPADIQRKILADTEEEQIPLFEFNYRAAVCEQCKKIVSVPSIYLHQKGYVYTGACTECGNAVIALNEGAEMVCPRCKTTVLSEKETGNWD